MITIDTYIIDDNLLHLSSVANYIDEYSKKPSPMKFVSHKITNYIQFYETLDIHSITTPSIFLIDIHLNTYFNGIDLAKKIVDTLSDISIIFMTFDDKKSIQVINSQIYPLGFITKQIEPNHFFKNDLFKLLSLFITNTQNKIDQHLFLYARSGNENVLIDKSKILYIATIKGWRGKLTVKTTYNEFIINGKLNEFKNILNNNFFSKTKSFIINTSYIESLSRIEGLLKFKEGTELHLGVRNIDKLNLFLKGMINFDE
jgi:two-component system response regulator AgrA